MRCATPGGPWQQQQQQQQPPAAATPLLPLTPQDWQDKERSFLKTSLARVQELELQRVNKLREALHNVTASYTTALLPLHHAVLKLQEAVDDINAEAELDELCRWGGGGLVGWCSCAERAVWGDRLLQPSSLQGRRHLGRHGQRWPEMAQQR